MRIGDIYIDNKCNFIRIDSFVSKLSCKYKPLSIFNPLRIVVNKLIIIDNEVTYSPSFNKLTTQKYIEKHYTLYKSSNDIKMSNVDKINQEIYNIIQQKSTL